MDEIFQATLKARDAAQMNCDFLKREHELATEAYDKSGHPLDLRESVRLANELMSAKELLSVLEEKVKRAQRRLEESPEKDIPPGDYPL